MTGLAFGPLIEARSVDHDLAIGRQRNIGAIHGARRGSLEVDAFTVVSAAVARALEFVFAGFPVGSATEMGTASVDHKQTIGRAIHPDAVFLLEFCIHSESEFGRVSDLENRVGFEKSAGKEEAEKCEEPCHQEAR